MRLLLAAHQLPPDEIGGVGLFTVHLASALRELGHEVTLLAGSEERHEGSARVDEVPPVAPGVRTLRLRLPQRPRALRWASHLLDPAAAPPLAAALRALRPEVLHLQHTLHLDVRLASLAIAHGAAVVATIHDYWPICQRIDLRRPDGTLCDGPAGGLRCALCVPRRPTVAGSVRALALAALRLAPFVVRTQLVQGAYARAHELTCPSPVVARVLQRAGFDGHRLTVVDYGIPPIPAAVAAAPRPRDPFRFGYLGTLGGHKGLQIALDALPLAAAALDGGRAPRCTLAVHGGPLRDRALRSRLDALMRQGLATYHGPYPEEALPALLAELDAVVIPSLWPETGPMVSMEAMAAGLPVVASRVGALVERIAHERDGLLVPAGDPQALAAALTRTIDRYAVLRRGACQHTVRTVRDAALELEQVYARVLRVAASERR
jgi:glycosyltransferase involved in cell wall biosynthesis